jgi:carbohydrate kinase (thermoresistant glucokinase family)
MGIYLIMGVSGSGKTTVAETLAQRTGGIFLDADDFHPKANKEKMAAGIPLTDEDRWGWLDRLNTELKKIVGQGKPIFLACSALKEIYRQRVGHRQRVGQGLPELRIIYLKGSKDCLRDRLLHRAKHFMPVILLDSQLATLEEPSQALTVSIDQPVEEMISAILNAEKL